MDTKYYNVDDEYKKNKNLKVEDVILLQNWLEKQSHLPKISEHRIITFLHRCKYNIERTKDRIENFYSVRAHWPEYMQIGDVSSENLKSASRYMLNLLLPISSKRNEMIIYWKMYNNDVNQYDLLSVLKLYEVIIMVALNMLGTTEGMVVIADAEGFTINHFLKWNAMIVRKFLFYAQQTSPIKIKAIHFHNHSPVVDLALKLVKPMLKKNTRDKMIFHSNIETLYDYIPREGLPNECGGNAGTFEELHKQQIKLLKEHAKFIFEEQREIADESKRMGKLVNLDDIFGTEGTFKKIDNID